jgi:hypothetical protein
MMQTVKTLLLTGALAMTAIACHKHDHDNDDESDTQAPVVVITAPALDASLSGAVTISATITDENSLHEYTMVIQDPATNAELFRKKKSVHNETNHSINETWTPQGINSETTVLLTISALDHGDNSGIKSVVFKVKS